MVFKLLLHTSFGLTSHSKRKTHFIISIFSGHWRILCQWMNIHKTYSFTISRRAFASLSLFLFLFVPSLSIAVLLFACHDDADEMSGEASMPIRKVSAQLWMRKKKRERDSEEMHFDYVAVQILWLEWLSFFN